MRCQYCGNAYVGDEPRCHGCGSPKRAKYRDADTLYAEVGHALITGEPDKSRALLEKIIGSPEKEPKKLWTERGAKIAVCLVLFWMFPWVFLVLFTMMIPFLMFVFLPYKGFKALFSWISGDTARR